MTTSPIAGLHAVMQQGRTIFANVEKRLIKQSLTLVCADSSVPFQKISWDISNGREFDLSVLPEKISSIPEESKPGEIFACWINHLQDWKLPNSDTIQLMVTQRHRPCQISFDNPVSIKQDDTPLYFHAKLGIHRANADLIVTFRNQTTGSEHTETVAFDHNFDGGDQLKKYQIVLIPLPREKGSFDVSFKVDFKSCTEPRASVDPFMFIADVRVSPKEASEPLVTSLEGDIPPTGVWLSAELPEQDSITTFPRIEVEDQVFIHIPAEVRPAYDFFDEVYYSETNPHLNLGKIELFEHFCIYGWRDKRDPNPEFCIQEYQLRHPEVERQDMNPLLHYTNRGMAENLSLGVFDEVLASLWENSSQQMPVATESEIFARAQDLMLPMEMINTRRLIAMVIPEHNAMSGGIYSIFMIADHLRRTRHVHGYDVIIVTRPNAENQTYLRNSAFRNSETIYRFEQLRLFRNVVDLQLHIPEYATVEFVRSLNTDMMQYLARRDNVHVNILNQNTRLMPEAEYFRDLRRFANSIGQSVAHHAYAGQENADRYNLPTLLLPAWTDLTPYPSVGFDDKENLIICSDDDAPYRAEVMKQLESLGDYRLVKIQGMTFDRYMALASRCRFSVTFGEGFDGYVAQPIYQGGIGFALYTDEFFPDDGFRQYENFFESENEMIEQIVPTIRRLEADKDRYVALNKALNKEWDALYNYDDYVARIAKLVNREYEVFPKPHKSGLDMATRSWCAL